MAGPSNKPKLTKKGNDVMREFRIAVEAHANRGAQDPSDLHAIVNNYKLADQNLRNYIYQLEEKIYAMRQAVG